MTTKVLKSALISAIKDQTIHVGNIIKLIEGSRDPQNASELVLGVFESLITDMSDRIINGRISTFKNYDPLEYEYSQVEYSYMHPTLYFFKNQADIENFQRYEYSQYRTSSNEEFSYALDVTVPMTGSCSVVQWNNYPVA